MSERRICIVAAGTQDALVVIRRRNAVAVEWNLPGSVIAVYEESYETAMRIVADEIGIEVSLAACELVGESRRVSKRSQGQKFRHFSVYRIALTDEQLRLIPRVNLKGDEVCAISRSEVEQYLTKNQRSFLRRE